jgi:multiple antibiotic resistance protein
MHAGLSFLIKCVIAIFVILNPFGNVPILLSLTQGQTPEARRRVVMKSSVTALVILLLFALAGQFIFDMFHITIGAFRIAGGIMLFIICRPMLYGEQSGTKITPKEQADAAVKSEVSITPMGTPMMAGPGTIVTVISLMDQASKWNEKSLVLLSIPIAVGLMYLILRLGAPLMMKLGEGGLRVMTRMMGLMLAVIAVQFVINGVHDALPQILGKKH